MREISGIRSRPLQLRAVLINERVYFVDQCVDLAQARVAQLACIARSNAFDLGGDAPQRLQTQRDLVTTASASPAPSASNQNHNNRLNARASSCRKRDRQPLRR